MTINETLKAALILTAGNIYAELVRQGQTPCKKLAEDCVRRMYELKEIVEEKEK